MLATSTMFEPLAVRVRRYVPSAFVRLVNPPSVYVTPPSLDERDSPPVSKFDPPLRVSERSLTSNPVTDSLKTIVIEPTDEFRGSGVTSMMLAVGLVVSVSQDSVALLPKVLPTASVIPDPLAFRVSK